jgi:hypothetical protein
MAWKPTVKLNGQSRTPVIFVSAHPDLATVGCSEADYIVARPTKPVKTEELAAALACFHHCLEGAGSSSSEAVGVAEDKQVPGHPPIFRSEGI